MTNIGYKKGNEPMDSTNFQLHVEHAAAGFYAAALVVFMGSLDSSARCTQGAINFASGFAACAISG
jgi:hypothetical protein